MTWHQTGAVVWPSSHFKDSCVAFLLSLSIILSFFYMMFTFRLIQHFWGPPLNWLLSKTVLKGGGVVGSSEVVMYLVSPGRPTDIGL